MTQIPTITINQDVKCKQCGKPGACKGNDGEYGICLKCVTKNLKGYLMKKTHEMVDAEVKNLLETEWKKIVHAYRNSCYELGVSIKISLAGNMEKISVITELTYYPLPKTKVKNNPVFVNEEQMPLALNI